MSKVFFSSCFADPADQRLAIRDRVIDLNRQADPDGRLPPGSLPVWMAESFAALNPEAPAEPMSKAMICVNGVRDSDTYFAVVRSRHGSGVALTPQEVAQVSFFELELFEAALLQKPAYLFVLDGAEMSPRLARLLDLLEPALPGLDRTPRTEQQIFDRLKAVLDSPAATRGSPSPPRASGTRMSTLLTASRFAPYDATRAAPSIRFLSGLGDPSTAPPNLDLVRDALARADSLEDHHDRLTVLWIAIRELMGAPIENPGSTEALPLWERALGCWNIAGAWYGLHGHPHMGCLASLGSLADLKVRMAGPLEMPHGALSSEYYSIAKTVSLGPLKRAMLKTSRDHIDAAFFTGENSNKLAQRGTLRWAQGDANGAIADYRRVVDLRSSAEQASQAAIGQGFSELGFALVFSGKSSEGLSLMEQGLALFEGDPPDGFLVRAQRKMGRAYLRAFAPRRALAMMELAYDNAIRINAQDQVSQIDRIAAAIRRRLR